MTVIKADMRVLQAKLWYAQLISAMILGLCVAIHLLIIFYAIRGGVTAQEILGRTRGNIGFAVFYEIFVLACFVHAPIGMANILEENFPKNRFVKLIPWALSLLIIVIGSAAVVSLFSGGQV